MQPAAVKWKRNSFVIAAFILAAVLTVPRAVLNYGWDGDSFATAVAAENLWRTGVYIPSRLPGNPLFEYLLAPLSSWDGHLTLNLTVLVFYFLAVLVFFKLADCQRCAGMLTLTFAFCPVLLLNAATCMDYVPALALILLAVWLAREGRLTLSALTLGLSIGFRITGILAAFLIGAWLLRRRNYQHAFSYLLLCGFTSGVFYIPVFVRRGITMFTMPPSAPDLTGHMLMAGYRGLMLLGPVAWMALVPVLILNHVKHGPIVLKKQNHQSLVSFLEISIPFLYGLLFLLHPDEIEYLLPVIPFLLLHLGNHLNTRQLALFGILILLHGFVTLELLGGESGHRRIEPRIATGILIRDWQNRKDLNRLRHSLNRLDLPEKSVVITGMGDALTYRNDLVQEPDSLLCGLLVEDGSWRRLHRLKDREIHLVYSLSRQNVELLQSQGNRVYMFSAFAPSIAINNFGYDPWSLGIERVETFNQYAFYHVAD